MAQTPQATEQVRVDHHAFRRAVSVCGLGLLLQAGIGITLLVFGLVSGDTAFVFTSLYALAGLIVWLGLLVVFYQHKLERLEALEEDELVATRPEASSVFDTAGSEVRVAGGRLRQMYQWLMPAMSIFLAVVLALLAWWMLVYMGEASSGSESATNFKVTAHTGWAIAIAIAFTAIGFVFSRFVAGMANLQAWQNLRGGAAYMVGNWLVLTAVAIGILFRFFEDTTVIEGVTWAIPIYMLFVAGEIFLNFVLNLYRPRMPGETPRPAFDSKVHSLLAAPDSLVRSMNEAVNYQFGFDVTSTWGYQLLLRSFTWLVALGIGALIVLNTVVVIEPHEQAVRLRSGSFVGPEGNRIAESGLLWKLPWPFESHEVHNVNQVRTLAVTPALKEEEGQLYLNRINLWTDDIQENYIEQLWPIMVQRSRLGSAESGSDLTGDEDHLTSRLEERWALVDAEVQMRYQIKDDVSGDEEPLVEYLLFASDDPYPQANGATHREYIMRRIAMRETTQYFADHTLDEVLSDQRGSISTELRRRIQARLDSLEAGVELLDITIALVRPNGKVGATFEDLGISREAKLQQIATAHRDASRLLTLWMGNPDRADEVIAILDRYNEKRLAHEVAVRKGDGDLPATKKLEEEVIAARVEVEKVLFEGGGLAAQQIADAETERWVALMDRRTQASRVQGQQKAYLAAPALYRQRGIMGAFTNNLLGVRKYVIGLDADRLDVDLSLTELNPMLNFGDAMGDNLEREVGDYE